MNPFKGLLAVAAAERIGQPQHQSWKDALDHVNQGVLDEAFSKIPDLIKLVPADIQPRLIPRRPKLFDRIVKKTSEIGERDGAFFKAVSDFIAFRVNCQVPEIMSICQTLDRELTVKHGAFGVFKGRCVSDNGKLTDIVQYYYGYVPSIGHLVEFQVGHELAAYTFTVDSALRDNPKCGEVDLWTNGVYNMLKTRLLEKANSIPPDQYSTSKYDLYDKTWSLFTPPNEPPDQLKRILDDITKD